MKFSELLMEQQEQHINEIFGMGSSEDKDAIKKAISDKIKSIKDVTLNIMHDTLGKLAKAGNALAKKLIKELAFDPKMAVPVYKKAMK